MIAQKSSVKTPSRTIPRSSVGGWLRIGRHALGTVLLTGPSALAGGSSSSSDRGPSRPVGSVFVGTNHNNNTDPSRPANQVILYRRSAGGTLTRTGAFDTGGQGSGPSQRFAGDGLGAGESVRLSEDRRWLFVANAGSDSVSVFRVHPDRLELTDVQPTGDGRPGTGSRTASRSTTTWCTS